jgi:signal transduction histidine kinase
MTTRPLRIAIIYCAAWLPFVAIYVGVLVAMTDASLHMTRTIGSAFLNVVGPAGMGVGVWLMTKRLMWPDVPLPRFLAAHAALSMVYAAGWVAWQMLIFGPAGYAEAPQTVLLRYVLPWQAAIGFILYGVVAGVSYAIRGLLRSRDLGVAAERAEKLRAQAELATLRAHINPHFFFNTLHSVTQFMRSEPRRAEVALEKLSMLFRYVLRLDRLNVELVTLEEEWQFTRTYIWLEQLRMGSRLVVEEVIDDDALVCAVPPFTLQPLVENAVRHGVGRRREGGTVTVRARERDGVLEICVSDDGVGASSNAAQRDGGLGSRAVEQRLIARWGRRAHADVRTAPDRGYAVTLTFPAEALGAVPAIA